MVSILKVDEIQNPSTGSTVINTKTPNELDCFYVNANLDNPDGVIHQWSRDNHSANSISVGNFPVGTGLTGPSGSGSTVNCFSFPTPGYYRIDLVWQHRTAADDAHSGLQVLVSVDGGSNYSFLGMISSGHVDTDNQRGVKGGTFFINVPSVTGSNAVKFRINAVGFPGSGLHQVEGTSNTATTGVMSYLLSQRIGEAVTS
tara:strand:- start:1387 stop:1989 length:603 start_codon:yes stop_codon:yes gene_type:complete